MDLHDFFWGAFIGAFATISIICLYWGLGGNRHNIAWNDVVCVRISEGASIESPINVYCATAPEFAAWAERRRRER